MKTENVKDCDVLSCIQPTGDITLANYFGAIRNWKKLQDQKTCIFGIVDLHAMTSTYQPDLLKKYSDQMIIDLLACGIDPKKSTLFVQSLIPEHVELSWILATCTSYGALTRQVKFKSIMETEGKSNAALLTYPILQAADILIYKAKQVPVGQDQKQHLELTKSIAKTFNDRYGDYFPIPKIELTQTPKIMSLSDPTQKMSKSAGIKHYVRLFENEEVLRNKIKAAITDDKNTPKGEMSPGISTLFTLLKACEEQNDYNRLMSEFENGHMKNVDLKDCLSDALVKLTSEFRYRREHIQKDTSLINDTIREMSSKAREKAQKTLFEVKELVGIKSISNF